MKDDKNKDKENKKNKRNNETPNDIWPKKQPRIFDNFEKQIREMQKRMNEMFQQGIPDELNYSEQNQPKIYGYKITKTPDGKTHINEFGNLKRKQTPPTEKNIEQNEEPFIDIQETEKEIYITTSLPRLEKKDINLEIKDEKLILKSTHPDHKFTKEITLPTKVKKKETKAQFNNGVLSITLKKTKKQNKKGEKIDID